MTSFLLGYERKIITLKQLARKTLGILSGARAHLMGCLELALRDEDQSAQLEGTYQTGLSLDIVISASTEVSIQLGTFQHGVQADCRSHAGCSHSGTGCSRGSLTHNYLVLGWCARSGTTLSAAYIVKMVIVGWCPKVFVQHVLLLLLTARWPTRANRYSLLLNLIHSVFGSRFHRWVSTSISVIIINIIIYSIGADTCSISTAAQDTWGAHTCRCRVAFHHPARVTSATTTTCNGTDGLMLRGQVRVDAYRLLSRRRDETVRVAGCPWGSWTGNRGMWSIGGISMRCRIIAMIMEAGSWSHRSWGERVRVVVNLREFYILLVLKQDGAQLVRMLLWRQDEPCLHRNVTTVEGPLVLALRHGRFNVRRANCGISKIIH